MQLLSEGQGGTDSYQHSRVPCRAERSMLRCPSKPRPRRSFRDAVLAINSLSPTLHTAAACDGDRLVKLGQLLSGHGPALPAQPLTTCVSHVFVPPLMQVLRTPVSRDMLGRIFNGSGKPIDGG